MAAENLKKFIEDIQKKIMEQNLEEAKAKAEKARVELETAKLAKEYAWQMLLKGEPGKGAS